MKLEGMSVFNFRFMVLILLGVFLVLVLGVVQSLNSNKSVSNNEVSEMEISLPFEGVVPEKYSKNGQDISPPVEFSQVPEETQSIALIVEDPDAPGPGKFTHWIIWDIPPEADLPEGLPNKRTLDTPEGAVQGRNGFGDIGYGGPKPPAGTHTYVFKAYALDTELDLEPGASKQEFQSAIKGKIIGKAKFSAEYTAG